jgi:hypothetical protein
MTPLCKHKWKAEECAQCRIEALTRDRDELLSVVRHAFAALEASNEHEAFAALEHALVKRTG